MLAGRFRTQTQRCWDNKLKDKKIHEDILQLLQKTPTGYYETKIALERRSYSSYKQEPISSWTQQRNKNIRENRKLQECDVPDDARTRDRWNYGTRAHSSSGGGLRLHPPPGSYSRKRSAGSDN